jgi:hypothetical protein
MQIVKKAWGSLEAWQKIALVIFLLHLFLNFQSFLPSMREINRWDESTHIQSGRFFVEGLWPSVARNPFMTLLYAILYLVYQGEPFWFLYSASMGRIILFCGLWIATILIANEGKRYFPPLILIGVVFVSPLFTDILVNPSDAMFAVTSGLAFWQLLKMLNQPQLHNFALFSVFMALAALSRNDGLVLFLIQIPVIFWLIRKASLPMMKVFANLLLPFILIVGGYVMVFWAVRGSFDIGLDKRSYVAFVQGHELVYQRDDDCKLSRIKCAAYDAYKKFGTPDENNNSVFRAIMRNPTEFAKRIPVIVMSLPSVFYDAYTARVAYLLGIFSLIGVIGMLADKQYPLMIANLGWLLYLGVYFGTFFRYGYFQSPFYITFLISAYGVNYITNSLAWKKKALGWIAFFVLVLIVAQVVKLPSVIFTFSTVLAAIVAGAILARSEAASPLTRAAPLVLFLMAGLLVRPSFPTLVGRQLGNIPEEQAILKLEETFPKGTRIAASSRAVAEAAKMQYFSIGQEYAVVDTSEALYNLLKEANVKAIYVDSTLSSDNTYVWKLIEADIGTRYKILYNGREGSILILTLKP